MRSLAITLSLLIVAVQYPLWFGKGGWLRVRELDQQLEAQRAQNDKLAQRNAALNAEVVDLKTGLEAIEERARTELGMIKPNEIFFHVLDPNPASERPDR